MSDGGGHQLGIVLSREDPFGEVLEFIDLFQHIVKHCAESQEDRQISVEGTC